MLRLPMMLIVFASPLLAELASPNAFVKVLDQAQAKSQARE
jgi:hypothetical protein